MPASSARTAGVSMNEATFVVVQSEAVLRGIGSRLVVQVTHRVGITHRCRALKFLWLTVLDYDAILVRRLLCQRHNERENEVRPQGSLGIRSFFEPVL